jgi:hypothetical protein
MAEEQDQQSTLLAKGKNLWDKVAEHRIHARNKGHYAADTLMLMEKNLAISALGVILKHEDDRQVMKDPQPDMKFPNVDAYRNDVMSLSLGLVIEPAAHIAAIKAYLIDRLQPTIEVMSDAEYKAQRQRLTRPVDEDAQPSRMNLRSQANQAFSIYGHTRAERKIDENLEKRLKKLPISQAEKLHGFLICAESGAFTTQPDKPHVRVFPNKVKFNFDIADTYKAYVEKDGTLKEPGKAALQFLRSQMGMHLVIRDKDGYLSGIAKAERRGPGSQPSMPSQN